MARKLGRLLQRKSDETADVFLDPELGVCEA